MAFIGPIDTRTLSEQMAGRGIPEWGHRRKARELKVMSRGFRLGQKARTILPRPMAPPRTGGFYGAQTRSAQEKKTIDTQVSNLQFNTTGNIRLVNGIATGTDFTNRIGRTVSLKSIFLRIETFPETAATTSNDCLRLMLVYDYQTNGVLPAITDILTSVDTNAMQNLNNRDRFKVICDKIWIVGGNANTTFLQPARSYRKVYKKCNYQMIFSGTDASIGSVSTGAIYLIVLSELTAGTTNHGSNVFVRTRFTDA